MVAIILVVAGVVAVTVVGMLIAAGIYWVVDMCLHPYTPWDLADIYCRVCGYPTPYQDVQGPIHPGCEGGQDE